MYAAYNFQLVMSLPPMSLGLRFCTSRKGRTGAFSTVNYASHNIAMWEVVKHFKVGGWVWSFKTHLKWNYGTFKGSIGLKRDFHRKEKNSAINPFHLNYLMKNVQFLPEPQLQQSTAPLS